MIRENTFSETTATALRTHQYSQTSCIITWFTPDRGRLSTIVKGCYRPKSDFLGQHDLFYRCELIYYNRDNNGLHVAKEFSPIKNRTGIRDSWRSATLASYIAALMCDMPQNDPHSRDLYDLTETALDALDNTEPGIEFLFWFELQFLQALGFAPHLASCSRCSKEFPPNQPVSFSVADGGLRCPKCGHTSSSTSRGPRPATIQPDTTAVLRSWQARTNPQVARNTKCSAVQVKELSLLLGAFLEFHIDFQHESRDIAVKLLRAKNKRKNK